MVSSLGTVLALLATQLLGAHAEKNYNNKPACDMTFAEVSNQTDLDFLKTCTALTGYMLSIDHEYDGPFELPHVESVPQFVAGYLGPKLRADRVEGMLTSISMPDLRNTTQGDLLFGYLKNLTELSLPRLEVVTGSVSIMGNSMLRNASFPSLTNVGGGIYLVGTFNHIDLSSLKSAAFIKIEAYGHNISCPGLGAQFASVNLTANMSDTYSGFKCWTSQENNTWDSHDPTGKGGLGKNKNNESAASTLMYSYHSLALVALFFVLL